MTVNDYFEIDMLLGGVDAFFYFYFFDDLYYIEDIQQAFKNRKLQVQVGHLHGRTS